MSGASRPQLEARLQTLSKRMATVGVEILVVTNPPNIFYLTNLRASAAVLIIGDNVRILITDFRYLTVARIAVAGDLSPTDLEVVPVAGSYDETILGVFTRLGVARVGIEAEHLSVRRWQWLAGRLDEKFIQLVPTDGIVEGVRERKDAYEIEQLQTASLLLSRVAFDVYKLVRAGSSEREIATEIDRMLYRIGLERPAFETIVASGENSALPHARPSDRRLSSGDLVVLDFGGIYNGYCGDLTRTVFVGEVTERAFGLHRAVSEAHSAAVSVVRPGIKASSVDGAAREVLSRHGFSDMFGHSTGHGLGIEVHERPRIGQRVNNDTVDAELDTGMVFTIEPGVYVPGYGGVRIEDDVMVTEEGCEILTNVPRALALF